MCAAGVEETVPHFLFWGPLHELQRYGEHEMELKRSAEKVCEKMQSLKILWI